MKNPFRGLFHHYIYDLRIKSKLVISHTIPILLPTAVLTGFLAVRMYGIITDDALRSEQALSSQTAAAIEGLVSHVVISSDSLSSNLLIQGLFKTSRENAGNYDILSKRVSNLFYLAESLTDHSLITDIKIYYDDSTFDDLTSYNQPGHILFAPVSDISSSYWYSLFRVQKSSSLFCPSLYLTDSEIEKNGSLAYITRIPYLTEGRHVASMNSASAYIAVYFSKDALGQMLENSATLEGEAAFLINDRKIPIASSDKATSDLYHYPLWKTSFSFEKAGEYELMSLSDGEVYACCFSIPETNWYMISIIPRLHITKTGKTILYHFASIYGFFALLALYIALYLSHSIADRIIAVALQMETVRSGCPQPLKIGDTGCDEIGVLSDTYNYMTEEINHLMDSQKKASEELTRAEFRALQAQINPHFLYNTLDMINWLAQNGQSDKVTQAVQALSRFYKLTLGRRELTNTIEDELTHVSLYVQLQNMRYDNCVDFVMDVPSELNEYRIPKLTFQPIVENAFLHGIMMKDKKEGTILLTGWRSEDVITFIISDDGAGIPPEKLDTLLEQSEQAYNAGNLSREQQFYPSYRHIGVYNTHLRLKSLYGDDYGLSFTSIYGQGTEVTIRIPAQKENT